MKRFLRLAMLLFVIGAAIYTYIHFSTSNPEVRKDHLGHISSDASAIIQFYDKPQFALGIEALNQVAGANCNMEAFENISDQLFDEIFMRGSLAIFSCENGNRFECVVERKNNRTPLGVDGWKSQLTSNDLNILTYPVHTESSEDGISFNDKEKPFFLSDGKARMIILHENEFTLNLEQNNWNSDRLKYTVHEISKVNGRLHLNGFSIPRDNQLLQSVHSVERTFSSIIPNSFESFYWNQVLGENEFGASESLVINFDEDEIICGLRIDLDNEKSRNLLRASTGKINVLNSESQIAEFFAGHMDVNFYALLKDWLICASSESAISKFNDDLKANRMWAHSSDYHRIQDQISIDGTSIGLTRTNDKMEILSQSSGDPSGALYNVIDVYYNSTSLIDPVADIRPSIENIVAIQNETPFEFTNHYTGETEWLFQDEDLNLVLMTKENEVLFKRNISEEVIGEFKVVDALKNNKFQIAFNTKNYIYIIDRKGRNLENFPIKLENEASNELSVVDYDNQRNYRLFIALDDGHIANYTISGKKVRGWNYKSNVVPIIYPITHLRLGNKDYLFTLNDNYEIQLLDRKGNIRHPLIEQPEGLNSMAFEIIRKDDIQNSGIRYSNLEGKEVDFMFGKSES